MELDLTQVVIVGIVASILAQIIKVVFAWFNKPINKLVVTIICFIVAIVLAIFWMKPELPAGSDPANLVNAYLQMAVSVVGFATIIYNVILDKIFELLGFTQQKVIDKKGTQ